jgi:hypothetical protein
MRGPPFAPAAGIHQQARKLFEFDLSECGDWRACFYCRFVNLNAAVCAELPELFR